MNHRERQELDRHITGNYGEDSVSDSDTPETDAELEFHNIARSDPASMASGMTMFSRKLEHQRDELLAALKGTNSALESLDRCVFDDDRTSVWVEWVHPAWDKARSAIKKIEQFGTAHPGFCRYPDRCRANGGRCVSDPACID